MQTETSQDNVEVSIVSLKASNADEIFSAGVPVLLDFWAPWCRPCRALEPMLGRLQRRFGNSLIVAKVNVDLQHEITREFNVRSIPTLLLVDGRTEVLRLAAAEYPEAHIVAELDRYFAQNTRQAQAA